MRCTLLALFLTLPVAFAQPQQPEPLKPPPDPRPLESLRQLLDGTSNTILLAEQNQLRFGVKFAPVTSTLSRQLKLKKEQGLIVQEIVKDSPGAKAGFQVDDILIELSGKTVPDSLAGLDQLLGDRSKGKTVEVVVLRDGKPTTLKELVVPEVRSPFPTSSLPLYPDARDWQYLVPAPYDASRQTDRTGWKIWAKGDPLTTTTYLKEDRFSTRQQEGSLVLSVHGTLKAGKAEVAGIKIQDGNTERTIQRLDRVPAEYRDKVAELIELSEKAGKK
jgi:hypothetical protein